MKDLPVAINYGDVLDPRFWLTDTTPLYLNKDFFTLATALRGNKPPKLIPYRLAYALAWVVERLLKLVGKKDYLVRTDAVYLSNAFREMDNSKARRELHWNPRPIAATIKDAVAWFARHDKQSGTL